MSSTHELGTHEEVESRLCDAQALVPNRNRHLSPERDLLEAKLHDESLFVDRFQEAWAEVAMNLDRGPDHTMRPPVELPGRFLGVLGILVVQPLRSSSTWARRLPVEAAI